MSKFFWFSVFVMCVSYFVGSLFLKIKRQADAYREERNRRRRALSPEVRRSWAEWHGTQAKQRRLNSETLPDEEQNEAP